MWAQVRDSTSRMFPCAKTLSAVSSKQWELSTSETSISSLLSVLDTSDTPSNDVDNGEDSEEGCRHGSITEVEAGEATCLLQGGDADLPRASRGSTDWGVGAAHFPSSSAHARRHTHN